MTILTDYLTELQRIHRSGRATDERSYYPALDQLFRAMGSSLTPPVQPLHDIAARGDGNHPDFLLQAGPADRAVVEAKGAADSIDALSGSDQVKRYLSRYGLVIATNLREFALISKDKGHLQTYTLAPTEAELWAARPRTLAAQHEAAFTDFMLTALTWDAPLARPADVAAALARFAREALRRLEGQAAERLAPMKAALAGALNVTFEDTDGEHFFRSSLVQFLFYSLFSGWVACHSRPDCRDFRWRYTSDYLGLPLLAELFDNIAQPSQLRTLDIRDPLEWAEAALNRTNWAEFSKTFDRANAINYFYEPFLEAFDPKLRESLGVWYTPPEIVQYQIARVDAALRDELAIPNGLADENVIILDPCCGTGAYLVETLNFIARRLENQGEGGLMAASLRKAAVERIFGFEIMPAPFVIAHMQIGNLMSKYGAALNANQRAGVYLTNALTGWADDPPPLLPGMPALKQEAEQSRRVKREEKILVILGNPPYNGFAGSRVAEENALLDAYRQTVRAPAPQGQGLNDYYVRFFRMAERRITERTGKGIISFISNYSWLDGLSFTGMRERYLDVFDQVWIDNLHGDRIVSEYAPDGAVSETIFAMRGQSAGIRVGTAISLLVRRTDRPSGALAEVLYRDVDDARADARRQNLLQSGDDPAIKGRYQPIKPLATLGYPLKPRAVSDAYLTWPRLPELFPAYFAGVKTARDAALVDIDKNRLTARMKRYFDPAVADDEIRHEASDLMKPSQGFNPVTARAAFTKRGMKPENIMRYAYRPFDNRWVYWEGETRLLDGRRPEYVPHVFEGNLWLSAGQRNRREDFYAPQLTSILADHHIVESNASMFPLYLKTHDSGGKALNLSGLAQTYLESIGEPDGTLLFYHAIAVLHSPAYRATNGGALRQDWPRIPLPPDRAALARSAALGKQLAALLDPEQLVPGVTTGEIRPELRGIGALVRVGGGQLNPDTDFAVTVNWGYRGRDSIVMPGGGRALLNTAGSLDVYLNDVAYYANVPQTVWEYTLGGYQVVKKWLSYRAQSVLGRALRLEEAREVTAMIRRIAAIVGLGSVLDGNLSL